jgi:hypothetical protein
MFFEGVDVAVGIAGVGQRFERRQAFAGRMQQDSGVASDAFGFDDPPKRRDPRKLPEMRLYSYVPLCAAVFTRLESVHDNFAHRCSARTCAA